jgi:hypothetical protein
MMKYFVLIVVGSAWMIGGIIQLARGEKMTSRDWKMLALWLDIFWLVGSIFWLVGRE